MESSLISQFIGIRPLLGDIGYYSKNVNLEYLECNEFVAKHLALTTAADIKHRTDEEFGWTRERINFLNQHDLQVMRSRRPFLQLEKPFIAATGENLQLLSYKAPLLENDKVIGITGISINVYSQQQQDLNYFENLKKELRNQFSDRESQVLVLLVRGKTAREIAIQLSLSKRTVEFYLNNIKNKMGVFTKSQLIEKIMADYRF